MLRVKRDILRRSSLGAMVTSRSQSIRAPGHSNEAFGVDGAFSFYDNVNFNGYLASTRTPKSSSSSSRNSSLDSR